MPKLNRYNNGGFVYGQWREVSRRVDPATGDIIITERREGSRDVKYNTRGVSWRQGYQDWLAAGNEGTIDDFKLEAEAWKRSQDKKEFDSQNRERRIKRKEEVEGDDEGKPSDDPRPDDFVGDSPGGGGPGGGGGSGDVSRPGKEDAGNVGPVLRPRKPVQVDLPDQSYQGLRYPGSGSFIPPGQGQTLSDEEVDRLVAEGVLAPPSTLYPPEFFGEVLIDDNDPYEPGDVNVNIDSQLEYNQRRGLLGGDVVKRKFDYASTNTYDSGEAIRQNIKERTRQVDGEERRSRGRELVEFYDSEGNRTFRQITKLKKGGVVPNNNNRSDMYHNKKEMGMGGMPKLMKKSMPGGGMVSPMEREMGMGGKMDYEMGGKMDMGHGGDLARAIKIFLMKKGGKTKFPDLTGDGKVTFADILKGRLKKKSQEYGGKVMENGGGVPEASADITRSPIMRELFDEVVSDAEGSPEFAQLMSTIKSFDERSAKQQRDPMFGPARSRAIARDRRAYEEAFPEVDRGRFDLDFDENPNDAKSVQSGFSNFTELVKSGDEDAMEMLVKMNDMYKEKFPGPEKFPVFRMFGVER